MNTYGRFTAAVGSVALNIVLALILAQGAGAAIPATNESVQGTHSYTVFLGADNQPARERCVAGLRARAIIAVVLALIV
jgi:hypothetical protein